MARDRRPALFLRRLRQSRNGNFTTLTALTAPVVLGLAAVAVDQGTLNLERRELQAVTDLAAIAASADPGRAETIVRNTFSDNGLKGVRLVSFASGMPGSLQAGTVAVEITHGTYSPAPGLPLQERFAETSGLGNSVRVRARKLGGLYFAGAFRSPPQIGTSAIGSSVPEATFSIGSRLARLDGGIANQLLGALTGSTISLSIMDYQALLSADVSLFAFLDALNTNLVLDAATYEEVLNADLSLGAIAAELARIDGMQVGAAASLHRLSQQLGSASPKLRLRDLIDPGQRGGIPPGAARPAGDPHLSAMELISVAALVAIANGSRQVSTNLALGLPGLASVSLVLGIGEPPQGSGWLRVGRTGDIVHTAQTRLSLAVNIDGPGGLLGKLVKVPLYVEIASGQARLGSVNCTNGVASTARVTIHGWPGVAAVRLADVPPARIADFSRPVPVSPAPLVTLPAVTVTGSAHLAISNLSAQPLTFTAADIAAGRTKQVATRDFTQSLTGSLLDTLQVNVQLAGIDLGLGQILAGTLRATLWAATPLLDTVLSSVLGTLGISLGEADIRVHGARCGAPVLVQ